MRRRAPVLCLALLEACAGSAVSEVPVPMGSWGGEGVELLVTASGATLNDLAGCFEASIQQPFVMDSAGHFAVDGVYVNFPLGSRPGSSAPAHFSGFVAGSAMTLTIALSGNSQSWVFVLNHGARPSPPTRLC